MGVYHLMACHDCRRYYHPAVMKVSEILMNQDAAAGIGQFCALHAGHRLELVPDERHENGWDVVLGYTEQDPAEDEDVQWAERWRATPASEPAGRQAPARMPGGDPATPAPPDPAGS